MAVLFILFLKIASYTGLFYAVHFLFALSGKRFPYSVKMGFMRLVIGLGSGIPAFLLYANLLKYFPELVAYTLGAGLIRIIVWTWIACGTLKNSPKFKLLSVTLFCIAGLTINFTIDHIAKAMEVDLLFTFC